MRRIGLFFPLALLLFPAIASADLVTTSLHVGAASEKSARAALSSIDARVSTMSLAMTGTDRFTGGDTILRFEQTHLGLPVLNRGATVLIDKGGNARTAVIDLENDLPSSITPTVSAFDATAVARTRTPVPIAINDAHLAIVATPSGGKLAWIVFPPMVQGIVASPRIIIDAQTKNIIEVRDMLVFANKANMYKFNPVTSPNLELFDLAQPITDVNKKLSNPFLASYNCVDNKTVKTVSFGGFMLPVHICDLMQKATADSNGDFIYQPIDTPIDPKSRSDEFSEVSMYYHATKVYEFFRTLQGDPMAQVVFDKPLRAISNLQLPTGIQQGDLQSAMDPNKPLDPFQNAFFSPGGGSLGAVFQTLYGFNTGAMWFGQGPNKDYSYDGDVVYHEFGHAVVDQTLKLGGWHLDKFGAIDSPGAMNEGLADYFSSAITGDGKIGEYASQDLGGGANGLRDIANTDTCLNTIVGEVHVDSTFFTGGLWSVRKTLSMSDQFKFDASIYKAMRMNAGKGDLGFEDLTNLIITTLKSDLPAAATALETEMTQKRGILPLCERIFPWEGKLLYPKNNRYPYYTGPGREGIFGNPEVAPGIFQLKADFSAQPATKVHMTFKQLIQSAGFGFGNMGSAFTPKILVKFGQPIQWTTKGKIVSDADVTVDATGDKQKPEQIWTAGFDVPEGAQSAYIQIGNAGDNDGLFADIMLDITPAEPAPQPDAGTGDSGANPMPMPSSGCSCDTTGAPSSYGSSAFFGLAGLALLLARRKR